MTFWLLLTVNSVTFGGLLFLLSAGFSLIFGLMRIPNLTHGSMFMVGAYLGTTFLSGAMGFTLDFWPAAVIAAIEVAILGALMERLLLRRLTGQPLAQVLVTLGVSFMVADLWMMLDRTRLGAMIRAGVDDPQMARVVGIRVSSLFTIVFALGAGLAGFAGMIGGPILSVYPGLDQDMLPLALVVVILGGTGSLLGSFVGSIIVGFLYNFGPALVLVLVFRPQGLFGSQIL